MSGLRVTASSGRQTSVLVWARGWRDQGRVLRVWPGCRAAGLPGLPHDRRALRSGPQTVRRYIETAQGAGVHRGDGVEAVDDGLIGAVADAVRPDGHGAAWEQLSGF